MCSAEVLSRSCNRAPSTRPTVTVTAHGDADGHGHGHGDAERDAVHSGRGRRRVAGGASIFEPLATRSLHKLDVYRCALELYRQIGAIVARFPHGEAELRSQMKRASKNVPHNIGEGVGKRGKARAASYEIALGEAKELIVALDCVEIDQLAPTTEIVAAQDLADRVSAMRSV